MIPKCHYCKKKEIPKGHYTFCSPECEDNWINEHATRYVESMDGFTMKVYDAIHREWS